MSHFQGHRLCNKLENWINKSCTHHNHSNIKQSEGTHLHHNAKNLNIYCSPYKTTSFETLLRKYPRNDEDTKNNIKFTLDKQNDQSYGLKRTIQSRMIKYDNIKSKIDTNLNALKNFKIKQNLLSFNDENKDTPNLSFSLQQQTKDDILQNNLKKKIKLNNSQFEKFQNKNNHFCHYNDENNQYLINRGQDNEDSVLQNGGKLMFKINVAKKINMFGMNGIRNEQCDRQEQIIKGMQQNDDDSNLYNENLQISVHKNQEKSQNENEENQVYESHALIHQSTSTKFVFKDLKNQQDKHQSQGDINANQNQLIFCFDEHQILEEDPYANNKEQLVSQNSQQEQNNSEVIEISKDQLSLIQEESNYVQSEILINAQQKDEQELKQISEEIHKMKENSDKSNDLNQLTQQIQQTSNNHSSLNICNLDHMDNVYQQNLQNLEILRENDTITKQNEQKQQQRLAKTKHQKPKRQRKSKEQTRILTRSNEEKLFLLNKLSMRLIRRKYGQDLTHAQLADKLLLDQNKVPLKAFLETECNQSKKFVFEFNQLTNPQMRSILTKYFMEEETKNIKKE